MITIGICDDNLKLQKKYQSMVSEAAQKHGIEIEVILFQDGSEVIEHMKLHENPFDILFLDILMNDVNGLETAEELRKLRSRALIIFLTSSEEYIFDTMNIKAHAYLMKDQLTNEKLEEVLLSAIQGVEEREKDIYRLEKNDNTYQFAIQDICFIKTYKGFCYIHHWDGIILENDNQKILDIIKGKDFFQVDAQYFVNLRYLQKIEKKQVVLSDTSHNIVPLDPSYAKNLKLAFTSYMMNQM